MAARYRSGAWGYSDPVSFEEMGTAAVSAVDRGLGSPFSLPGALATWLRTGRPLAEYESLYMNRPFARWTVRMGDGDRLFLEDGWGALETDDGVAFRRVVRESAGLVAPLHRPAVYRLGVRWRSAGSLRARVIVNDVILGSSSLSPEFRDSTLEVPAACLRPGRNHLRFRPLGGCRSRWRERGSIPHRDRAARLIASRFRLHLRTSWPVATLSPIVKGQTGRLRLPGGKALPASTPTASLVSGTTRHFLVYQNYDALLDTTARFVRDQRRPAR